MLPLTDAFCTEWLSDCIVDVSVVVVPLAAVTLPDLDSDCPTSEFCVPPLPWLVGVVILLAPWELDDETVVALALPVELALGELDVVVVGEAADTAAVVVPLLPTEDAPTEQFIWLPAKLVVLLLMVLYVLWNES